jgi:hypothetical protein
LFALIAGMSGIESLKFKVVSRFLHHPSFISLMQPGKEATRGKISAGVLGMLHPNTPLDDERGIGRLAEERERSPQSVIRVRQSVSQRLYLFEVGQIRRSDGVFFT